MTRSDWRRLGPRRRPTQPTTNVGHFSITLRSRDDRSVSADDVADRLKKAAERIPGATLYIEPVQDIQITTKAAALNTNIR